MNRSRCKVSAGRSKSRIRLSLRELQDRADLQAAKAALAEARKKGLIPWKKIKAQLGI